MKRSRKLDRLGTVGVTLLGLVAAAVSGYAVLQHRSASSGEPLPPVSSTTPSSTPGSAPTTPTAPAASSAGTVVVIGDTYSLDAPDVWLTRAATELGWSEVVNLSAAGRGFTRAPRSCDLDVCTTFGGSVDLIASRAPTLVVTFGGTADGDADVAGPVGDYFTTLRTALPDAHLVAINPLTTRDEEPDWLTDNAQAIASAIEAVGGQMIDVGQPGLGDGDELSADAQAEIGRSVATQLSGP